MYNARSGGILWWRQGCKLGHGNVPGTSWDTITICCFPFIFLFFLAFGYCMLILSTGVGWCAFAGSLYGLLLACKSFYTAFKPELLPSPKHAASKRGLKMLGAWHDACSSQCACVNIQSLLQVGHCLHTRWLAYCDEHASGNFGGGSANGCNHGARADSCRLCKAGFLGVAENKRRWR